MLFVIVFLFFGGLQAYLGTEHSLKTIQKQAQKEALQYKEKILHVQSQAQQAVGEGRCQAFGGCLKPKSSKESNDSLLLNDQAPIIFVSASMPLESLKTLALQAQKYQAKLVIRGLVKGSFQETAALVKTMGYPLDIDPKLFETHAIQKVPVFLVYHQAQWHQLQGNVELTFALEKVKGTAVPLQEQP